MKRPSDRFDLGAFLAGLAIAALWGGAPASASSPIPLAYESPEFEVTGFAGHRAAQSAINATRTAVSGSSMFTAYMEQAARTVWIREYDVATDTQGDPVQVFPRSAVTIDTHLMPTLGASSSRLFAFFPAFEAPGSLAGTYQSHPLLRELSLPDWTNPAGWSAADAGIPTLLFNSFYEGAQCAPVPQPWTQPMSAHPQCGLRANDGTAALNVATDTLHQIHEMFNNQRGDRCSEGSSLNAGLWCPAGDNSSCGNGVCQSNFDPETAGNGSIFYFRMPATGPPYPAPKVLVNSRTGILPDPPPEPALCDTAAAFFPKPHLIERDGVLHLLWSSTHVGVGWSGGLASTRASHNYDLFYARSSDDGESWCNLIGDTCLPEGLPYHRNASSGYGADFVIYQGETSWEGKFGFDVDSQGHPVIPLLALKPGEWNQHCGHVTKWGPADETYFPAQNAEYELHVLRYDGTAWVDTLIDDSINWAFAHTLLYVDALDRYWVFKADFQLQNHEVRGLAYATSSDGGASWSDWQALTREASAGDDPVWCRRLNGVRDPERRWLAFSCAERNGSNKIKGKFLRLLAEDLDPGWQPDGDPGSGPSDPDTDPEMPPDSDEGRDPGTTGGTGGSELPAPPDSDADPGPIDPGAPVDRDPGYLPPDPGDPVEEPWPPVDLDPGGPPPGSGDPPDPGPPLDDTDAYQLLNPSPEPEEPPPPALPPLFNSGEAGRDPSVQPGEPVATPPSDPPLPRDSDGSRDPASQPGDAVYDDAALLASLDDGRDPGSQPSDPEDPPPDAPPPSGDDGR